MLASPASAAPVSKLIPLGAVGNQVAISPDNAIALVTRVTTNNLTVIDVATNTIATTVPMTAPTLVTFAPDGAHAWIAGVNEVFVFDVATRTVTAHIPLSTSSTGGITFSPNGAWAYVTDRSGYLYAINTQTLAPSLPYSIPDGNPNGLGATSTHVYMSTTSGISVLTLATGVVTLIPVSGIRADSVKLSPDLSTLYVGTSTGISTISVTTEAVSTFFTATGVNARVGFSPDRSTVYVPHAGILSAVSASTGVAGPLTATTLTAIRNLAVSSDGMTAYETASSYLNLIAITAPVITPSAAPAAVNGAAYSFTVPAVASPASVFSLSAGALPAGTVLNAATGVISGTATASGLPTFSITATNILGSATRNYTGPIWITTANIGSGTVGTSSQTQFATTSPNPVTYSIASGSLPAGLNLNTATGLVTGTPTTAGDYTYTILASSNAGSAASSGGSTIAAAPIAPTITSDNPPDSIVGMPYSFRVTANGAGPIAFSVTSGALPNGLTLDTASGRIFGTATAAGTSVFTITVSGPGGTASADYTVNIRFAPIVSG